MFDGSNTYAVHSDHLSTPKLITDSDGEVVWLSVREAFGETSADEDVDGDGSLVVLGLRFPGQYFDSESGLHYNYFRDYDPSTGRYIESDPIGLNGGVNTYNYVEGNPVRYIDPLGLYKCICKNTGGSGGNGAARPSSGMKLCTYTCRCQCEDSKEMKRGMEVQGGSFELEPGSWICREAITGTTTSRTGQRSSYARGYKEFTIDTKMGWPFSLFSGSAVKGGMEGELDKEMDEFCEECDE